jgi:WD40 repeat protein
MNLAREISDRYTQVSASAIVFYLCFPLVCLSSVCDLAMAQVRPPSTNGRPELVIQTGHTWRIETLAFSQDGRLLASISGSRGDGTIKLWEVSTRRQLRTLVGHTGGVNAIALSPDGRWLASGSEDDTIRIWDVVTGLEVQRFYVPAQGVKFVLFSPDSRYLVSLPELSPYTGRDRQQIQTIDPCPNVKDKPGFCEARDLSVWDLSAGRFLFNITPPTLKDLSGLGPARNWHVMFAPGSNLLAVGVDGFEMQLWHLEKRKQAPVLAGSAPPLVFSSEGKRIATSSLSGEVVVWDLTSRSELMRLKGRGVPCAFSDHDTRLITKTGKDGSETLHVWNAIDSREIDAIDLDPIFDCANCFLNFSADGRWVARGGFGEPKLFLWDLAAPHNTPRAWIDLSAPIEFSPDGRWLAANTEGFFDRNISSNNIWLLDLETANESCASASPLRKIGAVAASSNPARLASASGRDVALWDLATGVRLKTLSGGDETISALAFSADGRWLVSGFWPSNEVVTWLPPVGDANTVFPRIDWKKPQCFAAKAGLNSNAREESGAVWDMVALRAYRGWPQMHAPIAVSSDNKQVANAYEGAVVNLWNLKDMTGTQLKLDRPPNRLIASGESLIRALAFSSRHHWLATAMDGNNSIEVWDLDTNKRIATLSLRPKLGPNPPSPSARYEVPPSNEVVALAFNPVSDVLVSATEDGSVRQWNVADAKEISSFHINETYSAELAFTRDGNQLAVTSGNKVVRWDINANTKLPDLEAQPNAVNGIAFSNDGKLLFTGGDDGTTRVWDAHSGELLATLIAVSGSNDWIVVTPEGPFDGTAGAWKQMLWRFDHNTFNYAPVESYFNDFFHPGLLQEIFEGKRPPPPQGKELAKRDRRRPAVRVELADGGPLAAARENPRGETARNVTIHVVVTENGEAGDSPQPRTAGAQDVRLFRNGSLVKLWRGDVFNLGGKDGCKLQPRPHPQSPRRSVCTVTVPIVTGPNNLAAYAFNHDNVKSEDATLTVTGAESLKQEGTLHILAVGVGRYANENYNLNYTPDDATSFASQLKLEQEKLGQYRSVEIKTLLNEEAKKENILAELKRLATTVQPEDAVVVYFSGHGKASGDHFYLVPHDLGYSGSRDQLSAEGLRQILTHSISDLELEEAFRGIDAGQIFMIVDACNSGQALENKDEPRRGPMNTRGLAQLAYEKGMYIMTASQNVEEAFVSEKLKHSYLTYVLVEEGLKTNAADTDHNGEVTLREWFDYAAARVPKLREETLQSKSLEEVTPTIRAAARNQKSQTPRPFYRREPDARPLVVAKVGATK